jgi:hypothetical protein
MAAHSRFLMQIVLKELSNIFHGMGSLVDVGGGAGGASISIAAAFPCMKKCSVLDLPHVVAKAPSAASVSNNVQFVAGDMFRSIPPANAVFLKVLWLLLLFFLTLIIIITLGISNAHSNKLPILT